MTNERRKSCIIADTESFESPIEWICAPFSFFFLLSPEALLFQKDVVSTSDTGVIELKAYFSLYFPFNLECTHTTIEYLYLFQLFSD